MSIIDKAKEFALRVHSNQRHGSLSIEDHLTAVTDKIREEYIANEHHCFFSLDEAITVGWLHDTIEDTSVTYEDIYDTFDDGIADALYNNRYHSFWKQLDEQYEQLLAIVNE
jgi:(p)ppGpp synthase/HD superfamily hydrolase